MHIKRKGGGNKRGGGGEKDAVCTQTEFVIWNDQAKEILFLIALSQEVWVLKQTAVCGFFLTFPFLVHVAVI